MRAVELLLLAGALLGVAAAVAAARRRRRGRGPSPAVERLLEAVPGQLGDAVLLLGPDARILKVNAAAALLAGTPPAELVGRALSALGPDLVVLAKGLGRGPVSALVSISGRAGPRRARAALLRVGPGTDVVVLRPEPAPRPPPLPRRAPPAAAERPPTGEDGVAVAAAVREPLDRAARAASLLRLRAPPLGARADAALSALEEALADVEHRVAALAAVSRPGARRSIDLAAVVEEVIGSMPPGPRVRASLGRVRALADDRPLRSALREVLRALALAVPAGEEVVVTVRTEGAEPVVEVATEAGAPRGVAPIARALLAPHGARVEEDAAAGHGWRLRVVLPAAATAAETADAIV